MKKAILLTAVITLSGSLSVYAYEGTDNLIQIPSITNDVVDKVHIGTELEGLIGGWYEKSYASLEASMNEKQAELERLAEIERLESLKDKSSDRLLLATFTSKFSTGSSNANRNHNIKKAAQANTILLKKGETFSFNKNTGPSHTKNSGYLPAPVIVNKKMSSGYGGGICQVSSTIYAVAKKVDGIKVVERRAHSKPVGYVSVSNEATVSYGQVDLKFQFNRDVYIECITDLSKGTVTANIWGKD